MGRKRNASLTPEESAKYDEPTSILKGFSEQTGGDAQPELSAEEAEARSLAAFEATDAEPDYVAPILELPKRKRAAPVRVSTPIREAGKAETKIRAFDEKIRVRREEAATRIEQEIRDLMVERDSYVESLSSEVITLLKQAGYFAPPAGELKPI